MLSLSYVASGSLITIVDDDQSVREALCRLLRSVGFAVRAFASAEAYSSSDNPGNTDCLLLDVRMPGQSGIELQRQLVAAHSKIPVIIITAYEDERVRAQAVSYQVRDVLIKPFSEEALLNAISKALSTR
jgi:FixJ family two-component response regulator